MDVDSALATYLSSVRRHFAPGAKHDARTAIVAIAITVLLVACSQQESSSSEGDAPSGADLYGQSCASCHGVDLRGTDQGPPHLSQVYASSHHGDASFRTAIAQGSPAHHWDFGDMPPVDGLSDDEVDLIIEYIRDQQDIQGLDPYPPG